MKYAQILLAAAISAAVAFAVASRMPSAAKGDAQPAFARVERTRTVRCAYAIWAPYIMEDPNTKKLSGFAYDFMEQIGKILGVKIKWTQEIPWSQIGDDLKSGRDDMFCQTVWPSGNRAFSLDFTKAVDYIGAYAFVRADDKRFDGDLAKINNPNVTIADIDGDYTQDIASKNFPEAKQYSLPGDSDGAALLMAVTSHKADVVFVDPFLARDFLKHNPGTLKRVAGVPAVQIFGDEFAVAKGETKLRDTVNAAIELMNQSGFIRRELDKYLGAYKGQYAYPAKPYETQ
ncbi:MAG: transporter substrate-binding domain-containing protein [Alphaproteobacteria bacterium]|nr:transporter substrate-binding domain-containing protein [Alphaproteobacteria bacterium]